MGKVIAVTKHVAKLDRLRVNLRVNDFSLFLRRPAPDVRLIGAVRSRLLDKGANLHARRDQVGIFRVPILCGDHPLGIATDLGNDCIKPVCVLIFHSTSPDEMT